MTKDERPGPGELLAAAFELINKRGDDYDRVNPLEENYREIAAVASIVIGKPLVARDIALILHCAKLVRSKSAPDKLDNYVDAMNYLAFAACFAGLVPITDAVEPKPISNEAARKEYNNLRNIYPQPAPAAE